MKIVLQTALDRSIQSSKRGSAETIQDYLRSFSNRSEVKYVVMDMNRDMVKAFFQTQKLSLTAFMWCVIAQKL